MRDKPHVNIGTIALIVFGIVSLFSLGITIYVDVMKTRDSDGDSIPDLTETNQAHSLFFDVSDEALTFRTYETGTGGHELGHNLGISHDGFSTHINVQLGLLDDVSTGIPVLDFNIKYDSLIEFTDDNSNGFFDPGSDLMLGKTMLDNMIRLGFGFGVDGKPVYYSSYSTIDGALKVDFYIANEHVLLGRGIGLLNPFELKSIITLTEYSGTNLALNLSLSSSHEIGFSETTLSATTSTGNYEVEYEWYDLAIINGVEKIVNTTIPSSPIPLNSGSIYINFGEVINGTYDPKLDWKLPKTTSFNIFTDIPWSYITIGSIAITAITSMASHLSRKKPGRLKYTDIPPPSKETSETITQSKKETREKEKKKSKGERFTQEILSDSDF